MIENVKNPKAYSQKIVLELVSEFYKFAGYKINKHKATEFLYTISKQLQMKL